MPPSENTFDGRLSQLGPRSPPNGCHSVSCQLSVLYVLR
jgi:hypothetical protein